MISINNLNISFGKEVVFKDFSLDLKAGDKLALSGESGIGKSTLLNLLAGFIPDFTGDISITGKALNPKNIGEIRKNISWLPQETSLNLNTVRELILTPFEFSLNRSHTPSDEKILELAGTFGLDEGILNKSLKEISGGQKQRILLTTCLLLKKPLLLLDEPTSALDRKWKKKVADYILGNPELTVIAVTHDDYWISHSPKTITLKKEERVS